MAKKLEKTGPLDFPMEKIFTLNDVDRDIVYTLNKKILEELFNEYLEKSDVDNSLKEAALLLKLLPDKRNIKFKIFTILEKLIKKPYIITKAIVTKDIKDTEDYMNLNHDIWIHPCNKNEAYRDSYPDLFYKSVEKAVPKINKIYELLYNKELTKEEIHKLFYNISFETGKHVSPDNGESQPMLYCHVKKI
jgi:hypothetical protein